MLTDDTGSKIENIIDGVILKGWADSCTAVRNQLCGSYPTSTTVKKDVEGQLIIKKEQAQQLETFSSGYKLWVAHLPGEQTFLTRGGAAGLVSY